MDVYKMRPGNGPFKTITKESFEEDTLRAEPWYQADGRGDAPALFAVCPACDNPIQIIGLYFLPANIKRPYGRHVPHAIPRLAVVDEDARENCPYFKPRVHQKSARRARIEGLPTQVLQLLIEQFDRVIYLLQKQTGVGLSRKLVQNMLGKYQGEQGYQYTGATLMNIPWIFAYMADSHSLFGQRVDGDPALAQAILEKVPSACIDESGRVVSRVDSDGKKQFFELAICYIRHLTRVDGEHGGLSETMEMVVSTSVKGQRVDVYRKVVDFDHGYFQNLINQPEGQGARSLEWVKLARQELGDLLLTQT